MEINGNTYGVPVEGTELLRHGNAPRRCPADSNRMAWFECTRCGEFKAIRVQSVKPGTTVSCGCKGRRQFIEHYQQRAENLPVATRNQIFDLAHHRNKRKRMKVFELVRKFNLPKYVIDFVIAAKCATLRVLACAGKAAIEALEAPALFWVESYMLLRSTSRYWETYTAQLDAMHWRDRTAYLAAEKKVNASVDYAAIMKSLRDDPLIEVEFPEAFGPADVDEVLAKAAQLG
jgi:hypothetical protein